jgi:hypothetical protein
MENYKSVIEKSQVRCFSESNGLSEMHLDDLGTILLTTLYIYYPRMQYNTD